MGHEIAHTYLDIYFICISGGSKCVMRDEVNLEHFIMKHRTQIQTTTQVTQHLEA